MQIEMKGIDKSFGTNQVLKDAGFVLGHGEVHALMGENGAGKSTLMKILTGVYTKDGGTVIVDGQEVNYKNPQEAEKAGIVFIHQELNVLFDLTVEENLFMGKEIKSRFGFCDQKAMRKKAGEALERLGVHINPGDVQPSLIMYSAAAMKSLNTFIFCCLVPARCQGSPYSPPPRRLASA